MNDPIALRGGILIIGSLLWDERRQQWRDSQLEMTSAETVTAPIRYGRLSGKQRGHTYTMVFSRSCPLGQAKVIRFSRTISSAGELIVEAEQLWKAEQPGAEAGRISAGWGCVALLGNPSRNIPRDVLAGWADRVAQESDYGNVPQAQDEGCLVGSDGILRIPWPCLAEGGAPVQLDFLLATTNHPTFSGVPASYPNAETIADAWNRAAHTHVEYFLRNIASGIKTFEDEAIRERLNLTR